MQVTNDGATILRSLSVDNPAAKVLISTTCLLHLPALWLTINAL